MNKILYSMCVGSLALALTAQGAQFDNNRPRKARAVTKQPATVQTGARHMNRGMVNTSGRARGQQNFSASRVNTNHRVHVSRQNNVSTNTNARVNSARFAQRNVTTQNRVRTNNNVTVNRQRGLNRNRDLTVQRDRNINRDRNVTVNRDRNVTRNVNRNVAVTNHWQSDRFRGRDYAAFRNYHRSWHDRGWWDSHYHNHITFVFGAPYFWDTGYWYPAWGYYPGASYIYDGPIYGYGNLTPDQVVANVQAQLQADGYYSGPVDGQMGPMTRQAIADFQADNGLAVTAAVDEPTLESLGLV